MYNIFKIFFWPFEIKFWTPDPKLFKFNRKNELKYDYLDNILAFLNIKCKKPNKKVENLLTLKFTYQFSVWFFACEFLLSFFVFCFHVLVFRLCFCSFFLSFFFFMLCWCCFQMGFLVGLYEGIFLGIWWSFQCWVYSGYFWVFLRIVKGLTVGFWL